MMDKRGTTVDAYIRNSPKESQAILKKVRQTIKKAAPGTVESISYGMPGYKYEGKVLAYFGAFKNHIGFFATPSAHAEFQKELSNYTQGKGSVQFPYNQPIPYPLITRMVKYKAKEIRSNKGIRA